MTTLFFLLLFFSLFHEINLIFNPKKYKEILKLAKEVGNIEDGKEKNKASKKIAVNILTPLFYLILNIIGLIFSSQWILFALLVLLSNVLFPMFQRISKNEIYKNITTIIKSFIFMLILLYIILNHFHHINIIPIDFKDFLSFCKIL